MTEVQRINPFTPGKRLTRPDVFAGRTKQLADGWRLLLQAGANNARHALITGDRGIGKSSLCSQIQGLARADGRYLQLLGRAPATQPRQFLVVEHIAQRHEDLTDLSDALIDAIQRARDKARVKMKWELEVNFGVFRAKVAQAPTPRGATTAFVDALEAAVGAIYGFAGIIVVIDEVDRIAENPGVPTFFKVATEQMAARGLDNVMLMPVGMIGVQELLKAEHPSVGRVFEVIHVPTLEDEEAKAIVTRALAGTGVEIEDDANDLIAYLSGGFPHPVHLIGSEAFNADTDGVIRRDDLDEAVEAIVSEKWKEEFDADFVKAGSGKNRDILKVMAACDETDVSVAYLCEKLNVSQPQLSSNLNSLMKRDVIVRTDRGVYRFKDPLFEFYVGRLNVLGNEPVERRPRKRTRR